MIKEANTSIYFPGLNGLRFFAAFAVIITHIELLKGQMELPNHWLNPFIFNLGGLGVYFFFVLSGFLITYLLLAEKEKNGTISVKNFYFRRALRIWPLYYLIVLLAFFVFPHFQILKLDWLQRYFENDYWLKFWFNILMLPNLALAMFPAIPHAGQVWSIGVEEQFYLIWPWLVKKSKVFLRTITILFISIILFKIVVLFFSGRDPGNHFLIVLKAFVAMSKIECMAIGAAGAYFLFTKNKSILTFAYNFYVQLISYIALPLLMYFTPDLIQDGIHIVYSIFFIIIILNTASNPNSILKFENRLLNLLGSISYGMYMYHMFIVVFLVRIIHSYFGGMNEYVLNGMYYFSVLGATILVSWLSFTYFEKPFSKRRRKFSNINSGLGAKSEA